MDAKKKEAMEYQESPDQEHSTYIYDGTRRFEVRKGTRCARVQETLQYRSSTTLTRLHLQEKAMLRAVHLWEQRWGELDWWDDCPQFLVSWSSFQVSIEMRVLPL
jgi:hypothetical protein